MPFTPVKEKFMLDQKIAHEVSQSLLEGDLILPDTKPDVNYLLNVDGKVCIDRTEVNTDRINFSGRLEVSILYIGKNCERAVQSLNTSLPIEDFMNIDGLEPDMYVSLEANIAHLDFKQSNERKFGYKAVIEVKAKVSASVEKEIVCDIEDIPPSQLKKSTLKISHGIANKEDKFVIKDELATPSGKPDIQEILNCRIDIGNKDIRIMDGQVNIKGDLLIKTLYVGDTEESLVEFMEHELPFNGSIEVENLMDDMFCDTTLFIQDQYVQVRPDTDGEDRILEVEVSVGVKVKVSSESAVDMIEDAYCINKSINMVKTKITYPTIVFRNRNQFPVRQSIEIPDGFPEIMQVYNIYGSCNIDEVKVIDDKVIAEGIIDTTILYVGSDDTNPVSAYHTAIPIKQTIEAKGALESMSAELEHNISHAAFNMLSSNEVEARFILDLTAQVIDEKEVELISDAAMEDLDQSVLESIPSMAVYVCQNDDTLWTIAKRYNASIDDLISLNEIDESMKIYPGQKLLIFKKAAE